MRQICAACGTPTTTDTAVCPNCGLPGLSGESPATRAAGVEPARRENLVATLAYVSAIPALILLFVRPYRENQFVRFHAMQSIAIAASSIVLIFIFLLLAAVPAINLVLIPAALIAGIGIALLVIVCMIKAYRHELFQLPVIGHWAQKQALDS